MSRRAEGLRSWLLQRISAVYLALFILYVVLHFSFYPAPDFRAWHEWVSRPLVGTGLAGFFLALLIHGWVGLRDVILDYIHHLGLRLLMLTLVAFLLTGCGYWVLRILIRAGY